MHLAIHSPKPEGVDDLRPERVSRSTLSSSGATLKVRSSTGWERFLLKHAAVVDPAVTAAEKEAA